MKRVWQNHINQTEETSVERDHFLLVNVKQLNCHINLMLLNILTSFFYVDINVNNDLFHHVG